MYLLSIWENGKGIYCKLGPQSPEGKSIHTDDLFLRQVITYALENLIAQSVIRKRIFNTQMNHLKLNLRGKQLIWDLLWCATVQLRDVLTKPQACNPDCAFLVYLVFYNYSAVNLKCSKPKPLVISGCISYWLTAVHCQLVFTIGSFLPFYQSTYASNCKSGAIHLEIKEYNSTIQIK